MRFFNSKPDTIPSPAEALPGRSRADHEAGHPPGPRHAARRPVARGHEDRGLRPRLLLGRREGLLAAPRRRDDGRRLRRRPHPEPDLRGGLLRADRPCRGRAGRLRPDADLVRGSCSRPSGSTTTRPRACARATTSAPATARSSSSPTTSSGPPPRPRRRCTRRSCRRPGYGAITTEIVDAAPNPFYYAEDYHQQYLDKNPRGYCPNHSTGVKLPDDFVVTPLQYVD